MGLHHRCRLTSHPPPCDAGDTNLGVWPSSDPVCAVRFAKRFHRHLRGPSICLIRLIAGAGFLEAEEAQRPVESRAHSLPLPPSRRMGRLAHPAEKSSRTQLFRMGSSPSTLVQPPRLAAKSHRSGGQTRAARDLSVSRSPLRCRHRKAAKGRVQRAGLGDFLWASCALCSNSGSATAGHAGDRTPWKVEDSVRAGRAENDTCTLMHSWPERRRVGPGASLDVMEPCLTVRAGLLVWSRPGRGEQIATRPCAWIERSIAPSAWMANALVVPAFVSRRPHSAKDGIAVGPA